MLAAKSHVKSAERLKFNAARKPTVAAARYQDNYTRWRKSLDSNASPVPNPPLAQRIAGSPPTAAVLAASFISGDRHGTRHKAASG